MDHRPQHGRPTPVSMIDHQRKARTPPESQPRIGLTGALKKSAHRPSLGRFRPSFFSPTKLSASTVRVACTGDAHCTLVTLLYLPPELRGAARARLVAPGLAIALSALVCLFVCLFVGWCEPAPLPGGVAYRLGSFIIKNASPKRLFVGRSVGRSVSRLNPRQPPPHGLRV